MAEKWAQKVNPKEGALKRIGGLSAPKLWASILARRVPYATAMRRVMFIANLGNTHAKKVAAQLKKLHDEAEEIKE